MIDCFTPVYKAYKSSAERFDIHTVEVVDFEEEDELLIGALTGKLVHRVDELGHGYGSIAILVKNTKCPVNEEGLQNRHKTCLYVITFRFLVE